jgi:hypothetical protein
MQSDKFVRLPGKCAVEQRVYSKHTKSQLKDILYRFVWHKELYILKELISGSIRVLLHLKAVL